MRVSEGIWTCSPRVMVLAPAPAPPPAAAPMAAPLPPPMMPPRMAPTAAPPPTFSAVFCAAALALDAVGLGGDGEAFSVAANAGEFDGEQGAAFVVGGLLDGETRPETGVPWRMTTRPSQIMSAATVPEKVSPCWVVALSRVWVMRMGMVVPAGMVTLRKAGAVVAEAAVVGGHWQRRGWRRATAPEVRDVDWWRVRTIRCGLSSSGCGGGLRLATGRVVRLVAACRGGDAEPEPER